MFDQTDQQSYEHVYNWIEDINKYTTDDPIKLIIGNKDDLTNQKTVSDEDINQLANKTGIEVISTSAKNANHVNMAFEKLTHRLITQRDKRDINQGYSLMPTPLEGKFASNNNCCNTY